MFGPQASLPQRIARTALIPYGPLFLSLALTDLSVLSKSTASLVLPISTLWVLCALVLVPALLFKGSGRTPGPSDEDGGGGSSPKEPLVPAPGGGGLPLPDAEQSRERVRDHVRGSRRRPSRRTAREPERRPLPRIAE